MDVRKNRPYGEIESPVVKLLQKERRRQRQLDQLRHSFGDLLDTGVLKLAQESAVRASQFSSLTGTETFRTIRQAAEAQKAISDVIREIVTPSSVLAMQRTAFAVSESTRNFENQMRALAVGLGPAINSASRALEANSQALATALGSKAWQEQISSLSRVAETLQPTMAALARSTDVLRTLDSAAFSARTDRRRTSGSRMEVHAQEAHKAEQALAALAKSKDPSEAVGNLSAFVRALSVLFHRLGKNSVRELLEMGLIGWLLVAITLLEAYQNHDLSGSSPQDSARLEQVNREVASLRDQLSHFEQFIVEADEQFLADLPRAETRSAANVRTQPSSASPRFHRLKIGTSVAIAKRRERWRLIVFRDGLTGRLSSGWVYFSSLTEHGSEPSRAGDITAAIDSSLDAAGDSELMDFSKAAAAGVLKRSEW